MKNYVKLYSVLLPSLILLFVFGTIGRINANNNSSEFEIVRDIIAIYPSQLRIENSEVTPDDYFYFHGEITRVKDCYIDFQSFNGQKYRIPGYVVMGYRLEDPLSKWEEPLLEMVLDPSQSCMAGKMDAEMFHKKGAGNFVGGILLGAFWVVGAALWSPGPEDGKNTYMMSNNRDLFTDPYYLECYKKKARGKNVTAALAGWGTWILLVILASTG